LGLPALLVQAGCAGALGPPCANAPVEPALGHEALADPAVSALRDLKLVQCARSLAIENVDAFGVMSLTVSSRFRAYSINVADLMNDLLEER
jgi:hypothetical protein